MNKLPNSFSAHGAPYWPWSTFFRKVAKSEILVIMDDVPMTNGRSYFNRCKLRSLTNEFYLTVPILRAGQKTGPLRKDVKIHVDGTWRRKHMTSISNTFANTPYINDVTDLVDSALSKSWVFLIDMNIYIIEQIMKYTSESTDIIFLSDLKIDQSEPSFRIADIAQKLKRKTYISGDGANNYLDFELMRRQDIDVETVSYTRRTAIAHNRVWSDIGLSCIDELCHFGPQTNWEVEP